MEIQMGHVKEIEKNIGRLGEQDRAGKPEFHVL